MPAPRNQRWRARMMLAVITLITVVPFGLAWYYARHPELIHERSNYGTLIAPPRPVDLPQLWANPLVRGESFGELKGRWVILQLSSGECDARCAAVARNTHQARLMLNKETLRVRRLLVAGAESRPEAFAGLLREDADLMVVRAPEDFGETVAQALGRTPVANTVLLMDPLGNLVLAYAPDFDPYRLVRDLRHLLKASQIG